MIRKAEIKDLEAINIIFNQAVEAKHQTAVKNPITLEMQLKWYLEHNVEKYPLFVLEIYDKIIGWCSLSAYRKGREALRNVAEVSYYIHNKYQGQGYGSMILEFALQVAPMNGFKTIIAVPLGQNIASIKLLECFNFEKWGKLPETAEIDSILYDHYYYGLKI